MDTPKNIVDKIFKIVSKNSGIAADLRRCENEAFQSNAWPYLFDLLGKDFQCNSKRKIISFIAASIAKSSQETDGDVSLGKAFAQVENQKQNQTESNQKDFSLRFKRVLAADNVEELCDVLRNTLPYLISNGNKLNFSKILNDLLYFNNEKSRENIKARWASEYLRVEAR